MESVNTLSFLAPSNMSRQTAVVRFSLTDESSITDESIRMPPRDDDSPRGCLHARARTHARCVGKVACDDSNERQSPELSPIGVGFQQKTLGVGIIVGTVRAHDGMVAGFGGRSVEGVERSHTVLKVSDRFQHDLPFPVAADGNDLEEVCKQPTKSNW